MKHALILTMFCFMAACGDGDGDGNSSARPTPQGAGTLRAVIDGTPFVPSRVIAAHQISDKVFQVSAFVLSADKKFQSDIVCLMSEDVTTETYPFELNEELFAKGIFASCGYVRSYSIATQEEDSAVAASGSLTILEHDVAAKRLRGTFEFVTNPYPSDGAVLTITDGVFDVVYSER